MRDSSFAVRKDIFAHPDILFLANDGRDITLHDRRMHGLHVISSDPYHFQQWLLGRSLLQKI